MSLSLSPRGEIVRTGREQLQPQHFSSATTYFLLGQRWRTCHSVQMNGLEPTVLKICVGVCAGTLPAVYSQLQLLEELWLKGNMLSGTIE